MNTQETLTHAIKLISALYKEGLINAATYHRVMEKYA